MISARAWLFAVLLGVAVPLLVGFSITSTGGPQTQRVVWDTFSRGTAYNTAALRSQAFSLPFVNNGYASAGGLAYFRADSVRCDWAIGGTTDGGSNVVVVDITHDDGGIDCQCSLLGDCTVDSGYPTSCLCSGGQFQTSPGLTYSLSLDSTTSCISNPAQIHCAVDLFR